MNKKDIRAEVIPILTEYLKTDDGQKNAHNLYLQLFSSPLFKSSQTIGVTLSMAGELDTQPIIDQGNATGKRMVIPRTLPNFKMEFVELNSETSLEKTKFGVSEPINGSVINASDIDLIVVPGLAFAPDGARVGFGAGFYDRYLRNYVGETVSLALKPQYFPVAKWDVTDYDVLIKNIYH
ncbi:5-formyltetrahydrofolate cyclo-ligase [Lentilactobacillus sp. SPB1-3]|uniref:5-formyltetrahydrofolate cyclo-ligase n=1 Tax=Lentilactobacillus terminaliae TaxID=3003483 RepID=A0ACD5DCI2_9LACO|nr:5-formyltetrahydrofolate cyclo-ligase [Lentilactobacillus sp. SPB1-3]MCZ0977115.1 5-formyltetrahydrofolate cyclo-ligase [Lentilactobacillus sp. SPB1-3]